MQLSSVIVEMIKSLWNKIIMTNLNRKHVDNYLLHNISYLLFSKYCCLTLKQRAEFLYHNIYINIRPIYEAAVV